MARTASFAASRPRSKTMTGSFLHAASTAGANADVVFGETSFLGQPSACRLNGSPDVALPFRVRAAGSLIYGLSVL
jgi:hypothetical protein